MDKFELLCLLEAISNYAYDIHYTAKGKNFYADHLFSERLADVDVKDDFIETLYLGESEDAPESADIARKVAELTPTLSENTQDNFKKLREMIVSALIGIENYKGTKGEEDLLGSVAHILQRHNGLLYRQLTYTPEEVRNDNEDWRDIVTPADTAQTLENDKWITIKPHGEESDDYRRLKLEDGESPKEAVERVYGKGQKELFRKSEYESKKKDDKKEPKKEDKDEKYIDISKNKYYNVMEMVESYRGKPEGTYDLSTGKGKNYTDGYCISFHQNEPDENGNYKSHYGRYTSEEYDKLTNDLANKYDLEVNVGVFDNEPEVSFWTRDKSLAVEISKEFNQHSYFDVKNMKVRKNKDYDKTKNPMQGD
ncbi:MAG: hypothetical protein IJ689_02710 [Alphaproteobacteria bacterium]|nr:hypothetical protein [Alphaproteobacteria bacterium]